MDQLDKAQRSAQMARVRAKDTRPEWAVRRLTHGLGYRYRLHYGGLPGRPDLVFPGRGAIIFVHGCFWHRHPGCAFARLPKSRLDFWEPKLSANRRRDQRNERALRALGWRVMIVWECQIANKERLAARIRRFLDA
ncbi:very short patch repair endonuclease [uncultured Xanthomonas sp.]|uniref:very short patch repair endonuclease n=1 Tax=uncultured Xanthomonas sp. TaxID=152831 RepID=UPI0025CCA3BE|nr:DNA mismatch endonuclease Vsr [uncultured Xanthomonas sp.]